MWTEDGFVLRFPETDEPPAIEQLLLEPEEAAELVLRQLGIDGAVCGEVSRERVAGAAAAAATGGWADAAVAAEEAGVRPAERGERGMPAFPILLEAYRECLRDVFDMPALMEMLRGDREPVAAGAYGGLADAEPVCGGAAVQLCGELHLRRRCSAGGAAGAGAFDRPGPAARADGRCGPARAAGHCAIEETEEQLQCLAETYKARTMDGVHDLLLRLGDLTREELLARCVSPEVAMTVGAAAQGAAGAGGERRRGEAVDCGGGCGALSRCAGGAAAAGAADGVSGGGAGCGARFGAAVMRGRMGRSRRRRWRGGLGWRWRRWRRTLKRLVQSGRVVEGGFRPGGMHREWCDARGAADDSAEVAGEAAQGG